jgi:hypothetical protein
MNTKSIITSVVGAALIHSLAPQASADVITDWNLITINATKTGGFNSNLGTRVDAIEAIAVYDAVNSINRIGRPYHFQASPARPASAAAAAAQAAHDVLVNYFPAQQAALDAALSNSLSAFPAGPTEVNGRAIGSASAADIIALRATNFARNRLPLSAVGNTIRRWR